MFHVPRTSGAHPRLVLSILACVVLIGGAGLAAALTARPVDQRPIAAPLPPRPPVAVIEDLPILKATLDASAAQHRFMGAVLVARGDQVIFRQAYGTADVDAGRPLDINSRFRLASVSKQFTAAAILRLQDQGKLSIGDPVCKWIQPCPAAWAPIRIHHLLSHTSGIPDLMARPGWGNRRVTPATMPELTADSERFGLSFEPGTKLKYDNAAFNLAADIVERASGMPFADFLQTEFFGPLGMADTGLGDGPGVVTGHANFPAGLTAQRQPNVSIIPGAGAIYSTLDDMLVWERALHGGHVLTPYSYAQMVGDHSPADEPKMRDGRRRRDWGYGIMSNTLGTAVTPAFQDWEIYHTGSWSGFRNLVSWQPDERIAVIVLTNNYHQQKEVLLVSQQAMAEALGRPFPTALSQ